MSVKKKVRVVEAKYVEEADSIIFVCECPEGRFRQQWHSSLFTFGNKDKKEELIATANLMLGKNLIVVFDPELDEKLKDHYPLKYE